MICAALVALLLPAIVPHMVQSANFYNMAESPRVDFGPSPVSLSLSGWGWCPAYGSIANVTLDLNGSLTPRSEAVNVGDIYLAGSFSFSLPDRTDNFSLELRGTKTRSVFFLKQVTGGSEPLIAEFEGTWLEETDYVACEGRLAIPIPNHVAKPYVVLLRTADAAIPSRAQGNFTETVDYIVAEATALFDMVADGLTGLGSNTKDVLGRTMTRLTVVAEGIREKLGTPYFT